MCKKVSIFLAVVLFILFFSLPVAKAKTVPMGNGDAVYRNMESLAWIIGHAGIYVGGSKVVHMQQAGCQKVNISNFNVGYWGSSYVGDSKVAKKRVDEANRLFNIVMPKFHGISYKNFGDKKPLGRCDGLTEWCFEKAGNDITNDSGYLTLTPQKQWQSTKVTRRYTTTWGKLSLSASLASWYNNIWN
ncbi:MAG: NlpC/P60 family protein [bacterium]